MEEYKGHKVVQDELCEGLYYVYIRGYDKAFSFMKSLYDDGCMIHCFDRVKRKKYVVGFSI